MTVGQPFCGAPCVQPPLQADGQTASWRRGIPLSRANPLGLAFRASRCDLRDARRVCSVQPRRTQPRVPDPELRSRDSDRKVDSCRRVSLWNGRGALGWQRQIMTLRSRPCGHVLPAPSRNRPTACAVAGADEIQACAVREQLRAGRRQRRIQRLPATVAELRICTDPTTVAASMSAVNLPDPSIVDAAVSLARACCTAVDPLCRHEAPTRFRSITTTGGDPSHAHQEVVPSCEHSSARA